MRKKLLVLLAVGFLLTGLAGMTQAALVTIGTAQFGGTGSEYNLIWDNNNNGNSVIWLDYHSGALNWSSQNNWAAGLDSSLTYNIDPTSWSVDWGVNSWRLPSALGGSEMSHLFYTELDLSGTVTSDDLNATNFDHLTTGWHWSSESATQSYAWGFYLTDGLQSTVNKSWGGYGLAVRSGDVSAVPIPGAVWLLGSGLLGLMAVRRRKRL